MNEAITPLAARFDAAYLDGVHPVRHPAVVDLRDGALEVRAGGRAAEWWRYDDLEVAGDGSYGEPVRLRRREGGPGETLLVEDETFLEALGQHTRVESHAPPLAGIKGWPAVILTCALIGMMGSAAYFWGVSLLANALAAITPPSVEARLGRAVANVFAPVKMRCDDPAREALLDRVARPLIRAAGSGYEFRIIYTTHAEPNAFAAPGGYIVVFQGLLDQAATPEEFAGVLAHEIMHVTHKHTTRALARHVSTQTLLSLMAMDSAGTPAALEQALALDSLRYQRNDEEEADREATRLLARAGIDPGGLATFLRRLHADPRFGGPSMTYLSSHPALLDRVRLLEAEVGRASEAGAPLLSPEEWKAARRGCRAR